VQRGAKRWSEVDGGVERRREVERSVERFIEA